MTRFLKIPANFALWLVLMASLLSAFISTGCASPAMQLDTFNKKVAAAYATIETIADGGNAAYAAGKLTADQVRPLAAQLREAVDLIDIAEHVYATDPKLGEDKLKAALVILTAIQAALALHGVH